MADSQPFRFKRFAVEQASAAHPVGTDGVLLGAFPGAMPGARLDKLVEQVRALDMGEVRRKLDEAESAGKEAA